MKKLHAKYSEGLFVAVLVSMSLAWKQRIADPWGLYLIVLSVAGFMISVVSLAIRTAREESPSN
ncbi:hypothetical protein [Arthrobacter sp. MYb213]|uniref:hypothetical protein n=1 Tax=Arthrobacter sp. MYb213 TaxID=1848595 RepID=UPI000CFDDDB5|nr:hypothetical protein [Arthrobacter sp. MYb213]PRB69349.1 hypothetical protein CQ011_11240 [Arthrobacter sp. MYb213]